MILTTITPVWRRPEMLKAWVRNIVSGSRHVEVCHLVYFVGEHPPDWWQSETQGTNIIAMVRQEPPGLSIGHYHNLGAQQAPSEWIMKLDVDVLPHQSYFSALLPLLAKAPPRQWFNGGMFYMNKCHSEMLLSLDHLPLTVGTYVQIMSQRQSYSASSYMLPAATNFICRREDYLKLGGCDPGFRGYGWEDYQQIYMLERHQIQKDPLPGSVTKINVTQRCRDLISRRKARELWEWDKQLCLIHKWHAAPEDPTYRATMTPNRELLFSYISRMRKTPVHE